MAKKKALLTKQQEYDFDFKEFFAIWAMMQGWDIPDLHLRVIEFLENSEAWENNTAVLQVFRGAAKSTIVGLYIVYKLVKNPAYRFLILSADNNTAVKITRDAQNIIERHPLAQHLKGRENTWRQDTFWVQGNKDPRTPSVFASGILANITGARADEVIFDDVEVPKNCDNDSLREQLRTRIGDTVHILVPEGKRPFVGTPHAFISIYPEQIENGAASLKIPLLTEHKGDFPFLTGTSAWPERFGEDIVAQRQLNSVSKGNFLSQYQLIPYRATNTIFDCAQIITYKSEIDFYSANSETVLTIATTRMVSCSAFWDPSMGKDISDDSVLSIVFSDELGHYYIHRCIKVTGDAEAQCDQIKAAATEYHLPQIIVETNGIGNFLPGLLQKALKGTGIAVDGRPTTKNKVQKITEAFEVRLASGVIHCHESVMATKFLGQLRDFNPKTAGRSKDDFIDASAAAILNEPIRITKGVYFSGGQQQRWAMAGQVVEMEQEAYEF